MRDKPYYNTSNGVNFAAGPGVYGRSDGGGPGVAGYRSGFGMYVSENDGSVYDTTGDLLLAGNYGKSSRTETC